MALERRQRDDLVAFVDATSTEHGDKFSGHLCRIQSVERPVRINQIRSASTASALALTQSFHPDDVAFFFGAARTPAGSSGGRRLYRAMLEANPDDATC